MTARHRHPGRAVVDAHTSVTERSRLTPETAVIPDRKEACGGPQTTPKTREAPPGSAAKFRPRNLMQRATLAGPSSETNLEQVSMSTNVPAAGRDHATKKPTGWRVVRRHPMGFCAFVLSVSVFPAPCSSLPLGVVMS
jgi:hypothetical protein